MEHMGLDEPQFFIDASNLHGRPGRYGLGDVEPLLRAGGLWVTSGLQWSWQLAGLVNVFKNSWKDPSCETWVSKLFLWPFSSSQTVKFTRGYPMK